MYDAPIRQEIALAEVGEHTDLAAWLKPRSRSGGYDVVRMRPRIVTLTVALLIGCGLILATTSPATPLAVDRTAPQLVGLRAFTLSPEKYAGDRKLLVTISPNGDGVRDMAKISFTLTERATVRLRIARTLSRVEPIYEKVATFGPGRHGFNWSPEPTTPARTYLTLLDVSDAAGNRRSYGAKNAETGRRPTAPVIRILGVEAGFQPARKAHPAFCVTELAALLARARDRGVHVYDEEQRDGERRAYLDDPFGNRIELIEAL